MWHYVYRLTCSHPEAGEKYYYGVRRSSTPPEADTRYWSSSRYVRAAIAFYGLASFRKKIVSCYGTREEAYAKEIRLHQFFDVKTHPLFLNRSNQTSTGFSREGVRCSPETVEKIRRHVRGRVYSPDVLAKRTARRGEKRSAAARQKMADAQRGICPSAETRAKMSTAHLGKRHSPETRARMSVSNRRALLGTHLSEETRAKLSLVMTGRQHSLETRAKIGAAQCGRVVSQATRDRIAHSQRLRHARRRAEQALYDVSPVVE